MPKHLHLLILATCVTTSNIILATLTPADAEKYTPNFNKTRPEFATPDRPISVPTSSPNPETTRSAGDATNTLDTSNTPRISPFSPPDAGVEGLGSQPIVPSINTLPGTDRPEFRVPDLPRPSPTP